MVKKTLELYECDVCGTEGVRYTVIYEDGQMTLDRCEKHGAKIEALRQEKGSWVAKTAGSRSGFKVSTMDEIKRQTKKQ